MGQPIVFTMTERDFATWEKVARARVEANERDRRSTTIWAPHGSYHETHYVGALCEGAVSIIEGRPVASAVHHGEGFRAATNKPDLDPWEVKGTDRWNSGNLIVPISETHLHHPDAAYLLVWWWRDTRTFAIAGWAWGDELLRPENEWHWLPKPAYGLRWPTLRQYSPDEAMRPSRRVKS